MSKVETLDPVQTAYQALITQDQSQNASRAQAMAILPQEAKANIVAASHYSGYFSNPITKPFMRKYILSKMEFPTKESELAQSITELNVRIDNLFNDAYMFEKAKLEVEEIDLEMADLEEQMTGFSATMQDCVEFRRLNVKLKKAKLEQTNKMHSLKKIELAAHARYNEAMGWKGCVEDIMAEAGYASLEDVDFNNIRMGEMAGKIKRWGELHAQGGLEITPSKLQAIDSNPEAFAAGYQAGETQKQIAMQRAQAMLGNPSGSAK